MGFWRDLFQGKQEQRAITGVPWVPFNYGGPLASTVNQDRALSLVPVFSAVRLLANTVATLPLKYFRRVGDERQPMSSPPQLFAQLEDTGQLTDWVHRCMTSLALRGDAIGYVTSRDGMQFPTSITWLNPGEVDVDDRNAARPDWFWQGRRIAAEDVLHIPWFTVPGRVRGLSPIEAYASTVNVGLEAQAYASGWFAAGGVPPGTFKNNERFINQEVADAARERLVNAIRTRRPIVYGKDWDYTPITINPEQAQFVETARLTATQIASIYGIPPSMIGGETGGSMTYANVEQEALNFVTFCLRPWLVKLERAFSAVLPARQYVKFNADALVRADLKTRYETYQIAAGIDLLTADEMRELEDRPPIPEAQRRPPIRSAVPAALDPPTRPGDVVPGPWRARAQ